MKKLEKMDGKLFESLKSNEMGQLSHLIGGYYTTATQGSTTSDTLHHYETWSATNGDTGANKDGLHDDSVKLEEHVSPVPSHPIEYAAFIVTESLPEQEVVS